MGARLDKLQRGREDGSRIMRGALQPREGFKGCNFWSLVQWLVGSMDKDEIRLLPTLRARRRTLMLATAGGFCLPAAWSSKNLSVLYTATSFNVLSTVTRTDGHTH